ncbi:hypothetical protein PL373_13420 [Tenacibaculum maritimum]|nr:hypothetical protein [Tenacibaculum maritimum]MDB0602129.1 hypothetical protein [Tenacibaculum maritimum]MDB0613804.1 hypothetical protein [Tenacibaculum maritimum]
MKAETVYNVIQALPEEEIPKLFKLLGVSVPAIKNDKSKRKKIITVEEAMDDLLATHFNKIT